MSFFALKISDPSSVNLVNEIKAGSDNFEVLQLNQLENELKVGEKVFIQLSGWIVSWEKGLIGLAEIIKAPFAKGYDSGNPRNFKLGLKMLLVLPNVIKREEFKFYADAYDAAGIGPTTRGEQNQAIKALTEKQAIAILRGMAEKEASLVDKIKDIFDESFCDSVFGQMACLVQEDRTYYEAVEYSKTMDLKNCLNVALDKRIRTKHPLNFIIYGAPGTGKTYSTAEYALAIVEDRIVDLTKKSDAGRKLVMDEYNKLVKNGQVVFTTFHQSYEYEEFIQGLRPDTKSPQMAFKIVDGIFKNIADLALNNPEKDYVIIIDEINRANISKVFGELITLIEDDKRWGEINQLSATLQSGDPFAVPNNLYIVGTMNSADKSISLIDAGLRRRFSFIEQKPDITLVADLALRSVLEEINLLLAEKLESTDLLVGHSYFMNKNIIDLSDIMNNNIIPLLYEYFYDQRKRVKGLLEEVIIKSNSPIEVDDDSIGRLRVKRK